MNIEFGRISELWDIHKAHNISNIFAVYRFLISPATSFGLAYLRQIGDTHKANNRPAIFTDYRVKIGYRQLVISLPNISLPTFCAAMSFCKT
jgi:hypothetical protein